MNKKILAAILSGAMILGMAGCSGNTSGASGTSGTASAAASASEPTAKIVVAFRTFGTVPADITKVQDEINKITKAKINTEVELQIIASGSYKQQMTLMLSGSEQLDVMGANAALMTSIYSAKQVQPLQELLDKYGSGIKEALGDSILSCGKYDNVLYAIPIKADTAAGYGSFMLRKDLCDKYKIDVSSIKTYDDLTKVFETIHQGEPNITVVQHPTVGYSGLQYNVTFDKLGDYFGVLPNEGQTLTVKNLFETDEYKNYLTVVRNWYQKGYFSKDVTTTTETAYAKLKAKTLFAYDTANKAGIVVQEQNSAGCELQICQVLPTLTVTGNVWQWTIPQNSKYPEKAMQFLNLMYTDKDVFNLLAYGIKDVHYAVQSDGTIDYPTGVTSSTSGYNMSTMAWSFGNEFNGYVWHGNDPALWTKLAEWNKTGTVSKAYGFVFNNASVANEIAAVQNVYDQYRMSLECGVVDPTSTLSEMNTKLYAAGLQKIIDEKQKQLNAWAAANNVK